MSKTELTIQNRVLGAENLLDGNIDDFGATVTKWLFHGKVGLDDIAQKMQQEFSDAQSSLSSLEKYDAFFERWHPFIQACEEIIYPNTKYLPPSDLDTQMHLISSESLAPKISGSFVDTDEDKPNRARVQLHLLDAFSHQDAFAVEGTMLKECLEEAIDKERARVLITQDPNPTRILPMLEHRLIAIEDVAKTMLREFPRQDDGVPAYFERWHPLMQSMAVMINETKSFDENWQKRFTDHANSEHPFADYIAKAQQNSFAKAYTSEQRHKNMLQAGIEVSLFNNMLGRSSDEKEAKTMSHLLNDVLHSHIGVASSAVSPESTIASEEIIPKGTILH